MDNSNTGDKLSNNSIKSNDNNNVVQEVTLPSTFYRKLLPSTCIDFASPEGQTIFAESLIEGYCKSYFHLASQFHTQSEPAYCGLATLTMILNSLSIDPLRTWKGVWRWFSEDLLDCCTPLDVVKRKGITIDEFNCLANCNGAQSKVYFASDSNLDEFRSNVIQCCNGNGQLLAASYNRSTLGQTGTGHFSPIAAYHSKLDLVLILDVARFKYPPHWVSLELLYEAMKPIDVDSGKCRGYIVLQKHSNGSNFCKVVASDKLDWRSMVSKLIIGLQKSINNSERPTSPKISNINQLIGKLIENISSILGYFAIYRVDNPDIFLKITKEISQTKLYQIVSTEFKLLSEQKNLLSQIVETTTDQRSTPNTSSCPSKNSKCSKGCWASKSQQYIPELITIIIFSIPQHIYLEFENQPLVNDLITLAKEPLTLPGTSSPPNNNNLHLLQNEIDYIKNVFESLYDYCSKHDHIFQQSSSL
eukprot:gene8563-10533_t